MNKAFLTFFCFFLINYSNLLSDLTLKEKFESSIQLGAQGSYIVTEYKKHLTFLRLHSYSEPYLILEEISLPSSATKKEHFSWESWLKAGAPEHTSWLLYKIDMRQGVVTDCYSFSREAFLSVAQEHAFLATLMTRPMKQLSLEERKRIGTHITDHPESIKIWNPPKIINGKKIKKPSFIVLQTQWPQDRSDLSGKWIDLYFDQERPSFPFPYWIEIGDGYQGLKTAVIDSGSCSFFPYKAFPHRPPLFQKQTFSKGQPLRLTIQSPSLKNFEIIATAVSKQGYHSTVLPHHIEQEADLVTLSIDYKVLEELLEKNLSYTLTLIPLEASSLTIEAPLPFIFRS